MSAQFIFSSMLAIQQHQLVFSCSVFLTQFFLTQIFLLIFLLFFYSADFTLTFEISIKFIAANSYFILCHALLRDFLFVLFLIVFCFLVWDFNQTHYYKLLSDFVQHFQKRFFVCVRKQTDFKTASKKKKNSIDS